MPLNTESLNKTSVGLKLASILSALSFAAVVAVNGLANALPLNGVNTGTLSDEIPNLFVPAGLTFSIWGLIYLLLAGYSAAIIRETWKKTGKSAWTYSDAHLFLINMAANIGWIFAWHRRMVNAAMFLMLVILGTLIALELASQKKLAEGGSLADNPGKFRKFFLTVPLRVYLGWISVATIANATAVLVKAGWNGFGIDPAVWTLIVIAAGLLVALGFSLARHQIAAPLVVVWAYAGIVIKRLQAGDPGSTLVGIAAASAGLLILLSFANGRIACPFRKKSGA